MKKLKKLLTLICVGTLVVVMGLFAACTGTEPEGPNNPDNPNNPATPTVSITLDKTTLALEEGDKAELTVTVKGSEAAPTVASSKTDVATATIAGNKVTVTAKAVGTADITVSVGEKSVKCVVTVSAATLKLSDTYILLEDADGSDIHTGKITVTGAGANVTATVADEEVATAAYANGKVTVTAAGLGKTKLTVKSGDDTKECVIEVANYGLEYEYVDVTDENGNSQEYMVVAAGEGFNATNLYIPGQAYAEDVEYYVPVTRIKSGTPKEGANFENDGGFMPADEDHDTIVTVYTGDNVSIIGGRAFCQNAKLTTVNCGPALRLIEGYAFDKCTALKTINWGENTQIKTLNRAAFSSSGLEEIVIPETVDFTGDALFSGCNLLTKVDIRCNELKLVYGSTFLKENAPEKFELHLSKGVLAWAKDALITWAGSYGTVEVFYAGTRAEYAEMLSHVEEAPESWTYKNLNPQWAYDYFDPKAENVTVHCSDDSAQRMSIDKTEINTSVHSDPIVITAATDNLDDEEVTAVSSNTAVATVEVNGKKITVTPVAAGTTTITVTCGTVTATCEATFNELDIADTDNIMVGIGGTTLLKANEAPTVADESIATVVYTDGIATINGVAGGKTTLTAGDETCTVWVGTAGLTYTAVEGGLAVSGAAAGITDLYIPGYATLNGADYLPIKEIATEAFKAYAGLVTVYTGENVVTIGDKAFQNALALTTVNFGAALKNIGKNAFEEDEGSLSTVNWGDSQPTTIGNEAFRYSPLVNIIVPRSVTYLGSGAFQACDTLRSIKILCDNLDEIKENTFLFVSALESSTRTFWISSGVKAIANSSFWTYAGGFGGNCVINYEGTEEEYNKLLEAVTHNFTKNNLTPGPEGANTTVNYEVDFTNL